MPILSDFFYKGPSLTLNSGRTITMLALEQRLTYAHILEGIPYGSNYTSIVARHSAWAKQSYQTCNVVAVKPTLRPVPIQEKGVPGDPLHIGNVCCTGYFESQPLIDDPWMISKLVIVWFQNGLAMPIELQAVQGIKAIDWDNNATDDSFD